MRLVTSPWVTPDRARILRDWEAIHQDAVDFDPSRAAIADILPAEEIDRVLTQLGLVGAEYDDAAHPDVYDYVGSALAVTLAGIAGFFLVNVPRHRGLLGADGAQGGWLSKHVGDRFGTLLPDNTIHALEQHYQVAFDPSTSCGP